MCIRDRLAGVLVSYSAMRYGSFARKNMACYMGIYIPVSYTHLDVYKRQRKATMNECDEFTVYFQPIINVKGEDVCAGAEALVRWNSATMGLSLIHIWVR